MCSDYAIGENIILSSTSLYVCFSHIKIQLCAHADEVMSSNCVNIFNMYIYGNMTKMLAFLDQGLASSLIYLVSMFKLTLEPYFNVNIFLPNESIYF